MATICHHVVEANSSQASGSLGSQILRALVEAGRFRITILGRKRTGDEPSGVIVKVVDFESSSELASALKGQDAFIEATWMPYPTLAIRLIDAAVSAGVYRIIPSEFSGDPTNIQARKLPAFEGKAKALDYIQKLAADGKITWTSISSFAFLGWGLRVSFLGIDLKSRKIQYLKPGTTVIPMTTTGSVGTAVANALVEGEATKNRVCYLYNMQKTQKDLVELAKQALGEEDWESEDFDTKQAFEKAMAQVRAGKVERQAIGDITRFFFSDPNYIDKLGKVDNDLLGIQIMSDDDIKELIREISQETSATRSLTTHS